MSLAEPSEDSSKACEATDGSTEDGSRPTFGTGAALRTKAAKGLVRYTGVVEGAANFMTAWHKDKKEESSSKRAGKRDKE